MISLSLLLMITLGRPENLAAITPDQPAVNTDISRSLWAAPPRSLCPPLDRGPPNPFSGPSSAVGRDSSGGAHGEGGWGEVCQQCSAA